MNQPKVTDVFHGEVGGLRRLAAEARGRKKERGRIRPAHSLSPGAKYA